MSLMEQQVSNEGEARDRKWTDFRAPVIALVLHTFLPVAIPVIPRIAVRVVLYAFLSMAVPVPTGVAVSGVLHAFVPIVIPVPSRIARRTVCGSQTIDAQKSFRREDRLCILLAHMVLIAPMPAFVASLYVCNTALLV